MPKLRTAELLDIIDRSDPTGQRGAVWREAVRRYTGREAAELGDMVWTFQDFANMGVYI